MIYYTSIQSPLNKQQSLELLLILLGLFCCVARVAEAQPTPPPEAGTGLEGSISLHSISKKDWKSRVGFYGPFEVDIAAGQIKKVQWNCDTGMQ